MIVGFLLLLSPLTQLPVSARRFTAAIWLHIGSYSFQPGEIAKIVIVLFFLERATSRRTARCCRCTTGVKPFRLPDIRTLPLLLLMWGIALVIVVFEKDLGSALVFFFVFLVMLCVATERSSPGHRFGSHRHRRHRRSWPGHVQVRVNTWLDPFADAQNTAS